MLEVSFELCSSNLHFLIIWFLEWQRQSDRERDKREEREKTWQGGERFDARINFKVAEIISIIVSQWDFKLRVHLRLMITWIGSKLAKIIY